MATIVFSTFGAEAGVSNYKYGKGKIIFEKNIKLSRYLDIYICRNSTCEASHDCYVKPLERAIRGKYVSSELRPQLISTGTYQIDFAI